MNPAVKLCPFPVRAAASVSLFAAFLVPACAAQAKAPDTVHNRVPDTVHRGAALFADKGCAHCHGANGIGGEEGPDLAHVRARLNASQIAEQIRNGGKVMPPYLDVLAPDEITDLVHYLRSKRKPGPPAQPAAGANPPG